MEGNNQNTPLRENKLLDKDTRTPCTKHVKKNYILARPVKGCGC